jgi:hypothetical protein
MKIVAFKLKWKFKMLHVHNARNGTPPPPPQQCLFPGMPELGGGAAAPVALYQEGQGGVAN